MDFNVYLLCCERLLTVSFLYCAGQIVSGSRGYAPNQGPAYNNILSFVTQVGGGHGGRGGYGTGDIATSYSYGSALLPTSWGSGGRGNGGRGGGFLEVVVSNKLRVEGSVSSNGESKQTGGAGGSILINTYYLDGDGSFEANGGAGSSGGGGGGGRIAIRFSNQSSFIGTMQALGGNGRSDLGGAGTVFLQDSSNSTRPYRKLIVINGKKERKLTPQEPRISNMAIISSPSCSSTTLSFSNAITVTTTAGPYCPYHNTPHYLSNVFRKGPYYVSASSSGTITIQYPFALYVHSVKVYPAIGWSYETSFKVSTYKSNAKLTDTSTWVDTFGAQSGLAETFVVGKKIDKV